MHATTKWNNIGILLTASLLVFLMLLANDTFAATGGSGMPWEGWITKLKNSLTGPVAFGVAVIAMVGAGCTLIFGGEISGLFKTMLYLVMALGLVISGQAIITSITGKGAEIPASMLSSNEGILHDA